MEELTLKQLIMPILRKWKLVVIVAVALAIVLGGYKGIKGVQQLNDSATLEKQQTDYETALKDFERQKLSLERDIENTKLSIERNKEYLDESILMQINPLSKFSSKINILIDNDYKISPQLTYQTPDNIGKLVEAYMSSAYDDTLYASLNDLIGEEVSPRYWNEMFSVTNKGSGLIEVKGIYDNEGMACAIADVVYTHLYSRHAVINKSIGEHSISKLTEVCVNDVDESLETNKKDRIIDLEVQEEQLAEKEKQLAEMKEPEKTVPDKSSVVKSALKYFLLGGFAGLFAVCAVIFLITCASPKIADPEDIRKVTGVKVLGYVPLGKKMSGIDKLLDKMEGIDSAVNENEALELVRVNLLQSLNSAAKTSGAILLENTENGGRLPTGQNGQAAAAAQRVEAVRVEPIGAPTSIASICEYEQAAGITEKLARVCMPDGIRLDACQSLLKSADAVKLTAADGKALIIVRRNVTGFDAFQKQLVAVNDASAAMVGVIITD